MTPQPPDGPTKRPKIRLPFDNRREDAGEWAYDHRVGLCITLIAYLVLGIAFVGSKIVISQPRHSQGIYIDLEELARLAEEKERLEEQVREKLADHSYDFSDVRNRASNENALPDDAPSRGGAPAADQALQERLRANREAYEQGLREEQAIRSSKPGRSTSEADASQARDSREEGNVTVAYSLDKPLRQALSLPVPAYQCEGGGRVIVLITVNRNGEVTGAAIDKSRTEADDCMRRAALEAAHRSRFNIDTSAPARHEGFISYIFVPQ